MGVRLTAPQKITLNNSALRQFAGVKIVQAKITLNNSTLRQFTGVKDRNSAQVTFWTLPKQRVTRLYSEVRNE